MQQNVRVAIVAAIVLLSLGTRPVVVSSAGKELRVVALPGMQYPTLARFALVQGTVRLRVVVAADGHVLRAQPIVEAWEGSRWSQEALLRAAAENTLQWRFAKLDNESQVTVEYDFRLEGERTHCPWTIVNFEPPHRVTVIARPPPELIH